MKFLIHFFAFSAVMLTARGALYFYGPDPAHPGQCYSNETGVLDYGDILFLNNCHRAICFSSGIIQVATCGVISAPCGVTPIDYSKYYPDCCPKPLPC